MGREEVTLEHLQRAREELLETVVEFFSDRRGVVGVLLVGSIPSGAADAYSDIDLRVFTTPDTHADFVNKRFDIPRQWGEFLFNEWADGTEVCVSHFRPFTKIDVFYWNVVEAKPSPWFNLPSTILIDQDDALKIFLAQCAELKFDKPNSGEVSRIMSKALACAHESLRRSRREELVYAQSMLERVRAYVIQIEDWIDQFVPKKTTQLKLEKRISHRLKTVLKAAYPPLTARSIEESLVGI